MDRMWQWAWDRFGPRYSWALYVLGFPVALPVYLLLTLSIVGLEGSDRYAEAAVVTAGAVVVLQLTMAFPDRRQLHLAQRWAAGEQVDCAAALRDTYVFARRATYRTVSTAWAWAALLAVAVGLIAGAPAARLWQYAVIGAVFSTGSLLIAFHYTVEAGVRPLRLALAGDSGIGDALPRAHPTFAVQANVSVVAVAFSFALCGAMLATIFGQSGLVPILLVLIAGGLTVAFAVPISVGLGFSPSMEPIRDLAHGAERVAVGDYSQRLPVVQDDDLGALAASFNRMQAGLAQRQRLQAAFGTYVDPALAARLLEQGDDVFTGERRAVTVMFVDIRDFTPFAETHGAEETVARLNDLFAIVVPAVVDAGGHVNKFLGDGALAVFGAPNALDNHADAALRAATEIHRVVAERFGASLRIGIGINTGDVIAGTIGAGGKLEFTLIGDTVNVAARVEQLTKSTNDVVLLTAECVDALDARPLGLVDRGLHVVRGKAAAVRVYSIDPAAECGSATTPPTRLS